MSPGRVVLQVFVRLLIALPFALWGGLALVVHTYVLPAESRANDVRLAIVRLKEMAGTIEEFRKANGRLPTTAEVHCDFKPCPQFAFSQFPGFKAEADGTFILPYRSFGVPFSPVRSSTVTYYSRDGTTDYDGWDQPWRWHLVDAMWISIDILIIAAPWLVMLAIHPWSRRRTPSAYIRGGDSG